MNNYIKIWIIVKIMSKISKEKEIKIKEGILGFIFENYPKMFYTYEIAEEFIRDDEFVLRLLSGLEKDKIIKKMEESSGGKIKRKWGMSKEVYCKYKELI